MDQRGGAGVFIGLVVAVIVIGFLYTIIYGVLGTIPSSSPNTATMQFLDFTLLYLMLPALLILIFWYLSEMQKSSGGYYG